MNVNHHPDKDLLERIDRALETRQPVGDALLDDLTHTVPQAAPEFQQQLEDQLLARMTTKQGEPTLTTRTANPDRKPVYFPLTLIAAMLAVLLVGSILLAGSGKMPTSNSSAVLQNETTTPALEPTASPLLRIVVAYQNLPRGFHFPDTLEGVQEVAGYAAWPIDSVPFTALSEDGGGLEQLVGKIARTDIFREQPILSSLIVENPLDVANVGSDLALIIPQNTVAITIPFTSVQTTTGDLKAGDRVNVIAAALMMNLGDNFQTFDGSATPFVITPQPIGTPNTSQIFMQTIVQNALVMQIGTMLRPATLLLEPATPTPIGDTEDIITLAVSPDEAATLRWVVDAKIPLTLSLTIPAEVALKPVVVARQFIPRGAQVTADDLTTIYLDPALVPQNTLEATSQATGQYTNAPIEAWQPVISSSLIGKPLFVERILPVNLVARGIPRTLITGLSPDLKNGDIVDVTAHFLYPVWPENALAFGPNTLPSVEVVPAQGGKVERGLLVQNVLLKGIRIYNMGDFNHPEGDDLTITLALSVEEAALLEWVTESAKPVALTLTRENEPVDLHVQTMSDGRLSVQLPIQEMQRVTAINETPVAPTSNVFDITMHVTLTTQLADQPVRTNQQDVYQIVAQGVSLLNSNEDIFGGTYPLTATFVIDPADLPALEWAVKSGMFLGVSWRP